MNDMATIAVGIVLGWLLIGLLRWLTGVVLDLFD
jgi:hypothetical protein